MAVTETTLLTRDEFRSLAMARDNGVCVLCSAPATEVHHIIERRLFDDGGYYLANAASVCNPCHRRCERTVVTVEEVRAAAGIRTVLLPAALYDDAMYDKWGNEIRADGSRIRGPLFGDPSVHAILTDAGVLDQFDHRAKYPRTAHLPWSPGATADDRVLASTRPLETAGEVVATEKLDGENTTWYADGFHARSIDSGSHPSRSWQAAAWAARCGDIPTGWRVIVENVYAVHSIRYDNLESYCYLLAVIDDAGMVLDFDSTVEWAALLDLPHAPLLYRGPWDESALKALWAPADADRVEGYVVRPAAEFAVHLFDRLVGKFVRPGHVTSSRHWRHAPVEANGLAQPITPAART